MEEEDADKVVSTMDIESGSEEAPRSWYQFVFGGARHHRYQ
jgi:hypothetical protein